MKHKHIKSLLRSIIKDAVVTLSVILAVNMACGCSRVEYVDRVSTVHDTISTELVRIDSIFGRDSIYYYIHDKGDSVFVEKYRDHYIYRDRLLHDSIYIVVCDTITDVKNVPAELTKWQRFKQGTGTVTIIAFLLALAAALVYLLRRFVIK